VSVVLLHGLGRGPGDWDGVREPLGRFGDVVTPTLPRDPGRALGVAADAVEDGAIVVGHSMGGVLALRLGARPLRALVLTGCFFPPARNGRALGASLRDYGAHRVAFVRGARRRRGAESSARALVSLVRDAARPGFGRGVVAPVLVVHARDDHHVPVDFAEAAARSRGWDLRVLERGGHHAHVDAPDAWLAVVLPWLDAVVRGDASGR
jgi:pimeloyl-ACP methyl ester carboxylesterase